jgi:hypothetical protein
MFVWSIKALTDLNQIKSNQIKSNQIKSNQIKSNQIFIMKTHTERQFNLQFLLISDISKKNIVCFLNKFLSPNFIEIKYNDINNVKKIIISPCSLQRNIFCLKKE